MSSKYRLNRLSLSVVKLHVVKLLTISLLISVTSACSNTVELSKALPNDPDFAPIMPEEEQERNCAIRLII